MTLLQALLMGVVQGLTEFLPVSSSGHLAIFQNLFGMKTDTGILFSVMLHVGTLVAVTLVFWNDIKKLFVETCRIIRDIYLNAKIFIENKKNDEEHHYIKIVHNNYRKFVVLIFVSTIPTGIMGYMGRHIVSAASSTLLAPGIGLLITGILLLVVDYTKGGKKIPATTTYANAMWIGICQGIATFPGISRSGMTISAALLNGLNRKFAIKYSFIMSIPAILGAAVLELKDIGGEAMSFKLGLNYLAGTIVAGVVGYFCIKAMLVLVRKKKFKYFAYYCFLIGTVAIVGNFLR